MSSDSSHPAKPLNIPSRQYVAPSVRSDAAQPRPAATHQAAVADLTRDHIDNIYANDPQANMPAPTPQPAPTTNTPTAATSIADTTEEHEVPQITRSFNPQPSSPYQRNHDDTKLQADKADWEKYHTAWQSYYQQYFHRYYAGHLQQSKSILDQQAAKINELSHAPSVVPVVEQTSAEVMTDLRSQIRHKVNTTARKVRRSQHFVPIFAGLIVMSVFAFLQYNTVLFANVEAYVSPASIEPSNMIVSPTSTVAVDDSPRLIIPKIAVDVPTIWDATPDHDSQMTAMKHGVAWFNIKGANARPGEIGNTVLSGHSSNDVFDDGEYKFVFARLEQLEKGDTFYINYEGTRYTYIIAEKRVVKPTDVAALTEPTDKPIVTLITCTPLGTATNRLLVTGEQVSPSIADAKKPAEKSTTTDASMPGNAPTFFERLFGGNR